MFKTKRKNKNFSLFDKGKRFTKNKKVLNVFNEFRQK